MYHLALEDRVYNYFVGFTEVDACTDEIYEHFREKIGNDRIIELHEEAKYDYMMQPMRLRNLTPGVPVISCLMISNSIDDNRLAEAVESFKRQTYPSCELIIFNDGTNMISCDEKMVKVVNYPEALGSLDDCVHKGIQACNGDIICLIDPNSIMLPWHVSVCAEEIRVGSQYWQPSMSWDSNMRPIQYTKHQIPPCVFTRQYLASNRISGPAPISPTRMTDISIIHRPVKYAEHGDPIDIKSRWDSDYVSRAVKSGIKLSKRDNSIIARVFICDILSWAESAIKELERMGADIEIVDNCSTNPSVLGFLASTRHSVVRLPKRIKQKLITSLGFDGLRVDVHSFFDLSELPDSLLLDMRDMLEKSGATECVLSCNPNWGFVMRVSDHFDGAVELQIDGVITYRPLSVNTNSLSDPSIEYYVKNSA